MIPHGVHGVVACTGPVAFRRPTIQTADMTVTPPKPSAAMHTSEDVHTLRHALTWVLLAAAAGAVNAGALMACGRFVTHVTGTLTHAGLDVALEDETHTLALALEYGLVVLAFVAGAMFSVVPLQARVRSGLRPLYAETLWTVTLLLLVTGVAGHYDIFGVIGGRIEENSDFALMAVLAFAMGLMNAAVSTGTAMAVRTTHMTGPATDFGVHLMTAMITSGEERRVALRYAGLRGSKIAAFAAGAAFMVPTVAGFGHLALFMPAALIAVATLRSFTAPSADAQR
jgi:uncharacterized membrane protein YoaK (UPF0700 family)